MQITKLPLLVLSALTIAAVTPRAAQAQWSSTVIGVAEFDTEDALLLLAGVSAGPGGRGWAPRIGVQATYLRFHQPSGTVDIKTIKPYVGMRNLFTGGSAGINVGYAISDRDGPAVTRPELVADRGEGIVLSGGWDYWGTGNSFGYQLLGSYNFESEALWTRARGTVPVARSTSGGATRLGAEVAFLSGDGYRAWQPGAIVEFNSSRGRILGLGAGMKFYQGGEDAVYFKAEFVWPLGR